MGLPFSYFIVACYGMVSIISLSVVCNFGCNDLLKVGVSANGVMSSILVKMKTRQRSNTNLFLARSTFMHMEEFFAL